MISELRAFVSAANHRAIANCVTAQAGGSLRIYEKGKLNSLRFNLSAVNPDLLQVTMIFHEPVSIYSHAVDAFTSRVSHAFPDDTHGLAIAQEIQSQFFATQPKLI
ncbi:hypothetical protein [uncultured Deefgea sp.]|uniref:hypothetical protein n=1 Tax=uncultured Deefgea sp. TaxID=1304914 RepID=UPI00262F6A3B|nr:hypothetical protein [uncultured Deefgea sp.]